ncbi:MAG TPA: rhomboid family intramembrane serine protease [Polyangiaceae bacterium]|nr:rhomboid family intramembrane serine protease [Polyangiaceae bacterium]
MRSPPPITNFIAYPVTAGIGLLAIAVTGLDLLGGRSIAALTMGVEAFGGEPWRLVTSVLPHGGALHLLFNVYWLWVLGTLVEEVFGHARMLLLLVLFAAGSAAAEFAIFEGGIGLSGVVYGLVGLSYVLSRRDRRFADAMDARTAQLFVLWFFFCIGATVAGLLRIANVAHGVGAVLGGLAGLAIAGRPGQRALWIGAIAGVIALSFACATVLRPHVNMSNRGGLVSGHLGHLKTLPVHRRG